VLAWLSVWSEVQTCIWPRCCHCHSLSLASVKSRLVLPFWYWLTRVVLDKGPLNGCVCEYSKRFVQPVESQPRDNTRLGAPTVAGPEVRARGTVGAVHPAGMQAAESPLRVWGQRPPEAAMLLHSVYCRSVFVNTEM